MARVKTVGSTDEVMKWFAEGRTVGRNRQKNLFIADGTIYSYGYHHPVAIRVGGRCIVNSDEPSITTRGHKWGVEGSLQRAKIPFVEISDKWTPFSLFHVANSGRYEIVDMIPEEVVSGHTDDSEYPPTGWGWSVTPLRVDSTYWSAAREGHLLIKIKEPVIATSQLNVPFVDPGRCFLYGRDYNQRFVCLLPRRAVSVRDAFRSLVPPDVVDALEDGVAVRRQGEWFFIATGYRTQDLTGPTLVNAPMQSHLGKRHVASETRQMDDRKYCRGIIRHPKHGKLKLGDVWHRVVQCRALISWTDRQSPQHYVTELPPVQEAPPSPPPQPSPPPSSPLPEPELTAWERIERARDKQMGIVKRKVFV